MSIDSSGEEGRDFVQSLARGLGVIRAFSRDAPAMTLTEVAQRTGLTRAAARRVLLTLQTLGYVESDGKLFSLRPQVLDLGYAYLSSLNVWEVAQPFMQRLVDTVHESSSAAVLDGNDIVFIAHIAANRLMTLSISVGQRLPAHATSLGRVLLAALPEHELERYLSTANLAQLTLRTISDPGRFRETLAIVRRQGYALVDREVDEAVRSIAVPIIGRHGSAVAAINVCAHESRATYDRIVAEFLPPLRLAAEEISRALGFAPRAAAKSEP